MEEQLRTLYRGMLEPALLDEILEKGQGMEVPEGKVLIEIGQYIKSMPLVLSGSIRIHREDPEGHELFLYYLNGGDTCAMSMNCCMTQKQSEIRAVAEEPTTLWMLPLQYMEEWVCKYSTWKSYVFDTFNSRLDEMLHAIDALAFLKMDERLLKYLLDKKQNSGSYIINKTHHEIAHDLNTSRVVISRLLKQLEREERIELHRNKIEIL